MVHGSDGYADADVHVGLHPILLCGTAAMKGAFAQTSDGLGLRLSALCPALWRPVTTLWSVKCHWGVLVDCCVLSPCVSLLGPAARLLTGLL